MMLKQRTSGLAVSCTRRRLCCSPAVVHRHHSSVARPLAAHAVKEAEQVTGTIFEPFDEVQTELATVSKTDGHSDSFARSSFSPECEAAINEQINIEYNASYVYHSLFAYFDRDNVGLPGFAKFFKDQSVEERGHAEMLMEYQNKRGGRVKFFNIVLPEVEYGQDAEKGDALYALELSLSLEKLNFTKLRELDEVAQRNNDAAMSHFIQSEMLPEQVDSVKEMAEYVSRLRRVGKGLGVYEFDKELAAKA